MVTTFTNNDLGELFYFDCVTFHTLIPRLFSSPYSSITSDGVVSCSCGGFGGSDGGGDESSIYSISSSSSVVIVEL